MEELVHYQEFQTRDFISLQSKVMRLKLTLRKMQSKDLSIKGYYNEYSRKG